MIRESDVKLSSQLAVSRCPHCNVDKSNLTMMFEQFETADHDGQHKKVWAVYTCARCGGVTTAFSSAYYGAVQGYFPDNQTVEDEVPERARQYLTQAIESQHAPSGAIKLAASSVDAMLKARGYKEGTLFQKIDRSRDDHVITEDMAKWAHQVRLDANDERHADEFAVLPTPEDARRSVEFAKALGTFLFVLPAHVRRGITDSQPVTLTKEEGPRTREEKAVFDLMK